MVEEPQNRLEFFFWTMKKSMVWRKLFSKWTWLSNNYSLLQRLVVVFPETLHNPRTERLGLSFGSRETERRLDFSSRVRMCRTRAGIPWWGLFCPDSTLAAASGTSNWVCLGHRKDATYEYDSLISVAEPNKLSPKSRFWWVGFQPPNGSCLWHWIAHIILAWDNSISIWKQACSIGTCGQMVPRKHFSHGSLVASPVSFGVPSMAVRERCMWGWHLWRAADTKIWDLEAEPWLEILWNMDSLNMSVPIVPNLWKWREWKSF